MVGSFVGQVMSRATEFVSLPIGSQDGRPGQSVSPQPGRVQFRLIQDNEHDPQGIRPQFLSVPSFG